MAESHTLIFLVTNRRRTGARLFGAALREAVGYHQAPREIGLCGSHSWVHNTEATPAIVGHDGRKGRTLPARRTSIDTRWS